MNYEKVAVFTTFLSIWATNYLTGIYQDYVAFFLIFSVGILHGSNDLALVDRLRLSGYVIKNLVSLSLYIIVVALAGLLFYFLPKVALTLFIIFSAFHFGEQHWYHKIKGLSKLFKLSFYLSYGIVLFFGLFYFNLSETNEIVSVLIQTDLGEGLVLWTLISTLIIFLGMLLTLRYKKLLSISRIAFELFLLVVFCLVFEYASLIWAFAIYFIFWHSVPSLLDQIGFLYGSKSSNAFLKFIKSSMLIWLMAILSIGTLIYVFKEDTALVYPLLFAGLGAITFAHSFIMNAMFNVKK